MRTDGGRELLEELAAAGVKVWADADDLAYEGPEEAITPEVLKRLASHKSQIMALLVVEKAADEANNVVSLHASTPDACHERLVAAGFHPKERLGKTIWLDPREGFWFSQEMALVKLPGEAEGSSRRPSCAPTLRPRPLSSHERGYVVSNRAKEENA